MILHYIVLSSQDPQRSSLIKKRNKISRVDMKIFQVVREEGKSHQARHRALMKPLPHLMPKILVRDLKASVSSSHMGTQGSPSPKRFTGRKCKQIGAPIGSEVMTDVVIKFTCCCYSVALTSSIHLSAFVASTYKGKLSLLTCTIQSQVTL